MTQETLVNPQSNPNSPNQQSTDALAKWRHRILPIVQNVLYFVTAVFFLSGLVQLSYLQRSIFQGPEIKPDTLPKISEQLAESSTEEQLQAAEFEAAIILESYVIERRYHQANTLLMTMAWIRYLGFSTGMILAVVGATFILGMLRENETTLRAESSNWKVALNSSSPGLIMVILGVMLMMTTIVSRQTFTHTDSPVYFQTTEVLTSEPSPARKLLPPLEELSDENE
ncbi:MAG: hypothetical protein AAF614_07705 [Chloroflexota bacterium]